MGGLEVGGNADTGFRFIGQGVLGGWFVFSVFGVGSGVGGGGGGGGGG